MFKGQRFCDGCCRVGRFAEGAYSPCLCTSAAASAPELRRSSVEQNWDINLDDLGFRQLCAKIGSTLCAFILQTAEFAHYKLVVLHGVDSLSWENVKIDVDGTFYALKSSSDGGLVCFALNGDDKHLVIVVVNPLTGDCRQLPESCVHPTQFYLMQLVMDQNTKLYKVVVLVRKIDYVGAMLFDSGTGMWANSGDSSLERFLGLQYLHVNEMNYHGQSLLEHPVWAFVCATGKLSPLHEHDSRLSVNKGRSGYAFVKVICFFSTLRLMVMGGEIPGKLFIYLIIILSKTRRMGSATRR